MNLTTTCLRKKARFCCAFNQDNEEITNLSDATGILLKIKGTRKLVEVRPVIEVIDGNTAIAKLDLRICDAQPGECE